jgi:NitT/TauT family transport system ATP-binding protein
LSSALVALRGLGLSFRPGELVLDGLDLDVLRGETLCLLGPSGCGKSTLLRLIAGLEQPDAGTLVWSDATARKKIGFVFQEPNLMPWADIWANVYLPLRLAGVSRRAADPLVREALARVGLAEAAKSLPRELSGGMKMRVSVARALVDRPQLLLLDEPFAALDEITRWQLNDALHALRRESAATVVFVTHSVYESAYLADRVAVMRARPGRIDALLAFSRPVAPGPEDRRGPAFSENCGAIADALAQAMRNSGP